MIFPSEGAPGQSLCYHIMSGKMEEARLSGKTCYLRHTRPTITNTVSSEMIVVTVRRTLQCWPCPSPRGTPERACVCWNTGTTRLCCGLHFGRASKLNGKKNYNPWRRNFSPAGDAEMGRFCMSVNYLH